MNRYSAIRLMAMLVFVATPQPSVAQNKAVLSCAQAVYSKPGIGAAYKGEVSNDDYQFVAKIPKGLTAWDGVADSAPFHGFTIFLDPKASACIVFEIHIRVDDEEGAKPAGSGKTLRLGRSVAHQWVSEGKNSTDSFTNITTMFSVVRAGSIVDGTVLLVAPTSNLLFAKKNYDEFIWSMRFGS